MVRLLADLLPDEARLSFARAARTPGTTRVVLLGDSYTFGLGVAASESLPSQLERVLDREDLEILNWGRPGMNLVHEWAFARQLLALVEVDVLVWLVSNDDAHPWRRDELAARGPGWEEGWSRQWDPEVADLELVRRALAEIDGELRARDGRLCVVYYQATSESDLPRRVLSLVAEHAGIPFVDLLPSLEGLEREALQISSADCHPTPLAHRIAAGALARALEPLLPPTRVSTATERAERRAAADDAERAIGAPLALAARLDRRDHHGRRVWNRTYRRAFQRLILEREVEELGWLGEALRGVERELFVAHAGHGHGGAPIESGAALGALGELARRGLDALAELAAERALDPASAASNRELSSLSGSIAARLEGVRALCARQASGATSISGAPDSALDRARLGLERLVRDLSDAARPSPRRARLAITARLPDAVAAEHPINVTLVVTMTTVHPLRKRTVELYYLVLDGRSHTHTIYPPQGTVGHAQVEVRAFATWAGLSTRAAGDFLESITLDGAPYTAGRLYLSPFELEES